ncbi:AAA family ATPase [Brevibacterium sp.]|uniref:AAA family ATPase n=1 Tax=Brevibacterium sp. TaxID=1701 RepID=UPI0025BCA570|nr:AAA family ATPase [Brevibacterium sp.]
MDFDQPPVVSVRHSEDAAPASGTWPMTVPAVAQILAEGLRLDHGVTFLVGENGSGKSTIVEGIAEAYGLNPEGGSTHARHVTRRTESPLAEWLLLQRGAGKRRWGFFLRAETMHSLYTYMESVQGPADPQFHQLSHGESFNALLDSRFTRPGFYCLDEPEAALSFSSTLRLLSALSELAAAGGQVLCATHSPILASLPGARILEVGAWGLRETDWERLELVQHWKRYLESPERYLRHLLDER